jgi:UDP-N-acetyl-2-amino-2-deoxyglucuronate dehydrogenase
MKPRCARCCQADEPVNQHFETIMRERSNFALFGAAGFVAPRHLKAIYDTGNRLVAAMDPHDSVGILDSYFPEASFFTEAERFDRHLEMLRRKSDDERVHYLSICSPNYLHDAHIRLAFRLNADAICEKPMVIKPWNLDALQELEAETGQRVYSVLQLRLHPTLISLKKQLEATSNRERAEVVLTYITRRGLWYHYSWKGDEEKSGGLAMNIGIHFFDFLIWLFGGVQKATVQINQKDKLAGVLELEWARVRWFLSIDAEDLPESYRAAGKHAYRSITINGEELELSEGFTNLHTRVYEEVLNGNGYGIDDVRPAIQLVHDLYRMELTTSAVDAHPFLKSKFP